MAAHTSFPRKRESTPQTLANTLPTGWIAAFTGMTGVSQMMLFLFTPLAPLSRALDTSMEK
jgi:hypothetical protein